jgi:hypothetical protein
LAHHPYGRTVESFATSGTEDQVVYHRRYLHLLRVLYGVITHRFR